MHSSATVGDAVGNAVGDALGAALGNAVGKCVGDIVGYLVGDMDGAKVGAGVGHSIDAQSVPAAPTTSPWSASHTDIESSMHWVPLKQHGNKLLTVGCGVGGDVPIGVGDGGCVGGGVGGAVVGHTMPIHVEPTPKKSPLTDAQDRCWIPVMHWPFTQHAPT